MEKIKSNSFLLFWSLLGLVAMIAIWFLPWRFQVNDDEIMMWLVSGAYTGTPESYAVFIHPLLSWTFSKLYTFAPNVPWYPLTWFLVIFLSYFAVILSLDKIDLGIYSKKFLALFLIFLSLHFGLFLQFTIIAGVAGFSGILQLLLWKRKDYKIPILLGVILITFSILIRWESFLLIFLGFGFYVFSFKSTKVSADFLKILILPTMLLVVLMGIKMEWEKQSEYAHFLEYNNARAGVSDHPVSYRLVYEQKLDEKSKWFFFSQWMIEEDDLSVQDLYERKKDLNTQFLYLNQLKSSLTRLMSVMKTEAFKTVFSLILIIFYLYCFSVSSKSLLFLTAWLFFFLMFNHFFILNGRVVILFFLPFLFPLMIEQSSKNFSTGMFKASAISLSLLFAFHLSNFIQEANGREIMRNEFKALTENLPANALLIMEGYKENYLGISYDLENQVPVLSLGWVSNSPFQKQKLQNIGLNSLKETKEFYLLGVDANDEYFFPEYMNYISEGFRLESKTESDNFILFHYAKMY